MSIPDKAHFRRRLDNKAQVYDYKFRYNEALIGELKVGVPYDQRDWNPQYKFWTIGEWYSGWTERILDKYGVALCPECKQAICDVWQGLPIGPENVTEREQPKSGHSFRREYETHAHDTKGRPPPFNRKDTAFEWLFEEIRKAEQRQREAQWNNRNTHVPPPAQSQGPPKGRWYDPGGRFRDNKWAMTILGLASWPTLSELKVVHRKLTMEYHPDRGGSHERMALINAARDYIANLLT